MVLEVSALPTPMNSQAEQIVHTTKASLHRIIPGDWEYKLAEFLLRYWTTPNPTSGCSPVELLMGERLMTVLDYLNPNWVLDQHHPTKVREVPRGT